MITQKWVATIKGQMFCINILYLYAIGLYIKKSEPNMENIFVVTEFNQEGNIFIV